MKKFLTICGMVSFSLFLVSGSTLHAQTYPEPEFANEVYYLKKDNPYSLVRLEKSSAKQTTKVSMIKAEYGYEIEGKSSPVRFNNGGNLSFIFSVSTSSGSTNPKSDSLMRANGMDPNSFSGFGNIDPASQITLYKLNIDGGERKILLQKSGAFSKKNQASDKYTFSLKKIRNGYWELIVDKTLPKGEYAFSMMGAGMQSADGSSTVYMFAID